MISKIALFVVSIMVVVGVIIAVSVMVKGHDGLAGRQFGPGGPSIGTKRVTTICELTTYKGSCIRSLEPAAKNDTATSKDYLLAVLQATFDEANGSYQASSKVFVDKNKDKYNYVAVEDCKVSMDLARDKLQDAISIVGSKADLKTLDPGEVHELLSWVTAIYAMHTSCLEQFEEPQFRLLMQKNIQNSTEHSHNAVNIIAELPEILKLFEGNNAGKKLGITLEHPQDNNNNHSNEGYDASWLKGADRKLLAEQPIQNITPNVTVALDGSGQYKTIMGAVGAYKVKNNGDRFVIYVKAGFYDEQVIIDKNKPNIFMYGDGIGKTVVTGTKSFGKMKVGTMHTATFANEAPGFIARGMTFRNKAGQDALQAVAFRSMGDRTAVFDCSFEGFHGTLFYQYYRQFYRNCLIYGTVDIIFGKGEAVIQDSEIIVRKPMADQISNVMADGKEIPKGSNGLVLQNCRIVPEKALFPTRFESLTYLGRPMTQEALMVVMQNELGDFIRPEGWKDLDPRTLNQKTCHVLEYGNRGPGARTELRGKGFANFKILTAEEVAKYGPGQFLAGDKWLPATGVPFRLGL